MVAVNEMSKDELYVWVVDLLAEMFELDKSKLSLQSNPVSYTHLTLPTNREV